MFTYLLTYFGAWGLGVGCGRVGGRGGVRESIGDVYHERPHTARCQGPVHFTIDPPALNSNRLSP